VLPHVFRWSLEQVEVAGAKKVDEHLSSSQKEGAGADNDKDNESEQQGTKKDKKTEKETNTSVIIKADPTRCVCYSTEMGAHALLS
jgi:hypothetical protein